MNLLILNTFDNQGGAAIATYRMHRGLRSLGVNSNMLVQEKRTDDLNVIGPQGKLQKAIAMLRPHIERVSLTLYKSRQKVIFSSAWLPEKVPSEITRIKPDIVHLFWINGGFLRIESIKRFNAPIVWTLHDMWPFTGGCHYDDGCGKFEKSCGDCPILNSNQEGDLSRRIWSRKQEAWKDVPITVVATSRWLANMARSSTLFQDRRIEVIPNGIDENKYKPANKQAARAAYNLPQDKRLILFSAFSATSDKRKGNHFLEQALEVMSRAGWGDRVELVVVGASHPPANSMNLGMKVHYMGQLHDEVSQVLLYSAADVLVAPSMQENLSNTVMESLACGTPVVAFEIGGMPDMIDHRRSGYLAVPFDAVDLAEGIMWVIENEERRIILGKNARQTVLERFTLPAVASRYLSLYRSLFNESSPS